MDDNRREALGHAVNFGAAANLSDKQVVEVAATFYAFLTGGCADLVEQVAADAKPSQLGPESLSGAPPGMRGQDLSNADQSPKTLAEMVAETARRPVGFTGRFDSEDDTKTRIISRAHREQFSEAK